MFQPRLPRLLCQMLLVLDAALTRPSPASRDPCQGQSPWMILLTGLRAISLVLMGWLSLLPRAALESPVTVSYTHLTLPTSDLV